MINKTKYGEYLKKERKSLFSLLIRFAVIPAFLGAFFISGFFVFWFFAPVYKEIWIPLFIFEIVAVFLVLFVRYCKKYSEFLKKKSDFRNDFFTEDQGYLMFSKPLCDHHKISIPDIILGNVHRKKKAVYQKVFYSDLEHNNRDKYFYCIITEAKLNALNKLYHVEVNYRDIGVYIKSMQLSNGVPLKIVTGQNSHALKEIQPVLDFEYTEEQLSAISDFNILLLDTEKNDRLEDRRLIDGTEKK